MRYELRCVITSYSIHYTKLYEVDGRRAVEEARQLGVAALGRLTPNPQLYDNMGRGVGTIESNRHLLERIIGYDKAFVHYHQGLFQETLPMVAATIDSVAILRLDGDRNNFV